VSFLWQDTNPSGAPCLTSGFYANSIVVFVVFYLVFLSIDGQQFHQYQQSEQPPLGQLQIEFHMDHTLNEDVHIPSSSVL
jgi:hypothetical protein